VVSAARIVAPFTPVISKFYAISLFIPALFILALCLFCFTISGDLIDERSSSYDAIYFGCLSKAERISLNLFTSWELPKSLSKLSMSFETVFIVKSFGIPERSFLGVSFGCYFCNFKN
jgi:hypothetical protein